MSDHVFYDEPAEKALLGACMLSPKAIGAAISAGVDATSFWSPDHGTIFSTIMGLHDKEATVDAVTVGSELNRLGLLEKVGGGPALTTLISDAPSTSGAATYAATVVQYARDRFVYSELSSMLNGQFPAWRERAETLINTADSWTNATEIEAIYSDWELVLSGEQLGEPPTIGFRDDRTCALLYGGKLNNIIGESESGKSMLAQWFTVQEAQAGRNVIYLDFEDGAGSVADRLMAMGLSEDDLRDHVRYARRDDNWTPADIARIRASVVTLKPSLCVVDGVTNAMTLEGLNPLDNQHVSQFYGGIPSLLRDGGAATFMVDHIVKARQDRAPGAIGAQHKRAGIDGVSLLLRMKENAGRNRTGYGWLTVDKDRPGFLREHAPDGKTIADVTIRSDGSSIVVELLESNNKPASTAGEVRLTGYMERVSRVLEGFGDEGQSGRTITRNTKGEDKFILSALKTLVAEGFVRRDQRGSAQLHILVKPYREEADRKATASAPPVYDDGDDLGLDE